jgi:hypothetical protein
MRLLLSYSRCFWPQINDQATTTNSESNQRIFQCHNRSRTEETQGHDRSDPHDPPHPSREVIGWIAIDKIPDQEYVGRVHQKEYGRIEGNWLWR